MYLSQLLAESHSWEWLQSTKWAGKSNLDILAENIKTLSVNSNLNLSLIGFEFTLEEILEPTYDVSFLLENIERDKFSPGNTFFDKLYAKLSLEEKAISSIWIEYDFPYINTPLIYLTMNENSCIDTVVRAYKILREFDKIYRKTLYESCKYPSDDEVCGWIKKCSVQSIQQFGLSYRDLKVQPRILASLLPSQFDNYLINSDLKESLSQMVFNQQCLAAFAYPFIPEQFFGCEVLSDYVTQCSLRKLRYPPRLKGSKFEKLLKIILLKYYSKSEVLSFLQGIKSFEKKSSSLNITNTNNMPSIQLSGWNHLKLGFKNGKNYSAKLYGGSVSNYFLT